MAALAGIMVTNGGPHPPEKWAAMTASQVLALIQIEPQSIVRAAAEEAKTAFGEAVEAALVKQHKAVQSLERNLIDKDGDGRLDADFDATQYVDAALSDIQAAAADTMFREHFQAPGTVEFLKRLLAQHFGSSMYIERSWHVDRNPNTAAARSFRRRFSGDFDGRRKGDQPVPRKA